MCGFTGYIQIFDKKNHYGVIDKMLNSIHHRGPDDYGILYFSLKNKQYEEKDYNDFSELENAIGFKRLSIIDLSPNGHQPMISNDKNTIIIFNGEIYNAFDFKDELISKGIIFKSKTDTEILLYLYKTYGINGLLDRIIGMFAIVIIDIEQQKIYFIRDHFGIKPFYYYKTNNFILFSSEIKSFYYYPEFNPQLNEEMLAEYFMFKYVLYPDTLLKNVYQLPPASYAEFDGTNLNIHQYYNLNNLNYTNNISYNEAIEKLDFLLKKSVKSQLLGDVKIGCQLSGGIDSSLITNYAREYFDANMDTFSIVFDDVKHSEHKWINIVNHYTRSDSHQYFFDINYFVNNLSSATYHHDHPLHLPNTIAIKLMSNRARENVTVLLSGEGADELFGGYSRFYDVAFRSAYNNTLNLFSKINKLNNKYYLKSDIYEYIINASAQMNFDKVKQLIQKANYENIIQKRIKHFPNNNDFIIKSMNIYEIRTYMTDLLIRQDKMTMAHSIENRVPFLDKNLVEFVLTLPDNYKVQNPKSIISYKEHHISTKRILKTLAIKKFDKKFVFRKKQGFSLPLIKYFNDNNFKTLFNEKIKHLEKRQIVSQNYLNNLLISFNRNENIDLKIMWQILALEVWLELFIDRKI